MQGHNSKVCIHVLSSLYLKKCLFYDKDSIKFSQYCLKAAAVLTVRKKTGPTALASAGMSAIGERGNCMRLSSTNRDSTYNCVCGKVGEYECFWDRDTAVRSAEVPGGSTSITATILAVTIIDSLVTCLMVCGYGNHLRGKFIFSLWNLPIKLTAITMATKFTHSLWTISSILMGLELGCCCSTLNSTLHMWNKEIMWWALQCTSHTSRWL